MRIVLDTNVISDLMRPEPHPAVLGWVAAQPRATFYTTDINRAEILSTALPRCPRGGVARLLPLPLKRCSRRTLPGASCRSMALRRPATPTLWLRAAGLAILSKGSTR